MAAKADPKQFSPKFTWPVAVGILLFALAGTLTSLDAEVLNFLGDAKGPAFSFLTLTGMALAAYLKGDPLRVNSAAQAKALEEAQKADRESAEAGRVDDGDDDEAIITDYEEYRARHAADPEVYDEGVVGLSTDSPAAAPEVGR